jgi:hypothetical protein
MRPGLLSVVQVTDAVVAALTAHVLPSMIMEYFVVSATKLVPVNVTTVPPVTVPYLGFIPVRSADFAPSYVTYSDKV